MLSILSSSVLIMDMIVHVMQAACPHNSLPCMAEKVYLCKACNAHSNGFNYYSDASFVSDHVVLAMNTLTQSLKGVPAVKICPWIS